MLKDNLHTLERIDVKDRLPREGSYVLVWGVLKSHGWRWVDVLEFRDGRFIDPTEEELNGHDFDYTDSATHWADLTVANWNDGLPLYRNFVQ